MGENNNFRLTAIKIGSADDERVIWDSQFQRDNYTIISGSFAGNRNDVDVLEFEILREHPLYDWLEPMSTLVYLWKSDRWEFTGRILKTIDVFDDGLLKKKIICESAEAFLNDCLLMTNGNAFGITPNDVIKNFTNRVYNAGQPKEKQIQFISVTDPYFDTTKFKINDDFGKSGVEALNVFFDSIGATFNIRRYDPEIDGGDTLPSWALIMNVYSKDHDVFRVNQPVKLGYNIRSYELTEDATNLATEVYATGRDDLSNGSVNDAVSIAKYGKIIVQPKNNEIVDKAALTSWAKEYLNQYKTPIYSLSFSTYDLSYVDNVDAFKVGNIIRVFEPVQGIDVEMYIESLKYDLLSPYDVQIDASNKSANFARLLVRSVL
ncbi:phage tail protein [Culicoidibacter larvae]|uniref:Tail spike domain-containing protein n=1 Tax=Culicoidibacter larvae TaxID=2579976 RepID=A0A5R8QAC2_9FIRM|nr:phage tail protein [Culicoidibacter larvae]TLG72046.1 hypothetical protein FEZ08_09440 [Culicoidibacter larvae]